MTLNDFLSVSTIDAGSVEIHRADGFHATAAEISASLADYYSYVVTGISLAVTGYVASVRVDITDPVTAQRYFQPDNSRLNT